MRMEKKYNLLDMILQKHEEHSSDWEKDHPVGSRNMKIQQSDYDTYGRSDLLKEARELEEQKLIKVKWIGGRSDMEYVQYRLEQMPRIYEMTGRIPKLQRVRSEQAADLKLVEVYAAEAESSWLKAYYGELSAQIHRGKALKNLEKHGELLFQCLNALEKLEEPVFIRIFSSYALTGTKTRGSKVFKDQLQSRVIRIAKRYHPMVDDTMNDRQVLEQLYLTDYSQELAVKGDLKLEQPDRQVVDLGNFPGGVILTTETLKSSKICGKQEIKKIITVENKANFAYMPYEKGTLILFCHGFFSPLEREFLRELEGVLEQGTQDMEQSPGTEKAGKCAARVEYYHTGDLDYGGVRIFKHIREHVFPKLQPLSMDAAQFDRYLDYGTDMEPSSWEKLKNVEEPLLQQLIDRILTTKKVIEQEVFLIKSE